MSGGTFEITSRNFDDVIERLRLEIRMNPKRPIEERYPVEIIEKFVQAIDDINRAKGEIHYLDYLFAGDYGNETFLKEWEDSV